MNEANEILKRISLRAGLYANIAKQYLTVSEQTQHEFIIECNNQLHNERAKKMFGKILTNLILQYCSKHKEDAVIRESNAGMRLRGGHS